MKQEERERYCEGLINRCIKESESVKDRPLFKLTKSYVEQELKRSNAIPPNKK